MFYVHVFHIMLFRFCNDKHANMDMTQTFSILQKEALKVSAHGRAFMSEVLCKTYPVLRNKNTPATP